MKHIYSLITTLVILIILIIKKYNFEKFTNNNDIVNIYYINLEKRRDRKKNIETELKKLKNLKNFKFKINRFNAIKSDIHGGIGCSKSHIEILKIAKKNKLPYVIIIEDDIEIKNNKIEKYFNIFKNLKKWDVIILSGWGKKKNRMSIYQKQSVYQQRVGIL